MIDICVYVCGFYALKTPMHYINGVFIFLITHFLRSTNYFNMEEIKQLSDDVLEQIKDFPRRYNDLSDEQTSLINKLIPDEELKECYRRNGLCKECKQPKNSDNWCRCNFQRNFKNWTSGNDDVDKFIQKAQLKPKDTHEVLEWIEHDRFENIEYLA